ncbi:hypothetical protein AVEN_64101-1, partial [Araneus ventricosus]
MASQIRTAKPASGTNY